MLPDLPAFVFSAWSVYFPGVRIFCMMSAGALGGPLGSPFRGVGARAAFPLSVAHTLGKKNVEDIGTKP